MDDQNEPDFQPRTSFAVRFFNQWHRYKNLIFKFWWILLLAAGLSTAAQWFFLSKVHPTFMSFGRMIVNVKLSIPNANIYSEEMNTFFGTQVALMQSDSVINRVKQRLQSANPPLNSSPVSIQVTLSSKTSIFNLTAEGEDPVYTQAYLAATMEEYIKLKEGLLSNASNATKSGLLNELAEMDLEIQKSKAQIFNYQASNSMVLLQQNGGNSAASYLASLTQKLTERKSELQMLQTLTLDENLERQQGIFAAKNSSAQTVQLITPTQQGSPQESDQNLRQNQAPNKQQNPAGTQENNPPALPSNLGTVEAAYLQAKQQIVLLKARRESLSENFRPKHPKIAALDQMIANQEKLLEIFRGQSQEQLKNRRHTMELEINDLEDQISIWKAKAMDASKKLTDYEVLKENDRRLKSIYDQLQATLQQLDADTGINQESVSIFEPATPAIPKPIGRLKHLIMASLIGLTLGAGILALLNLLDDRPATLSELEEVFDEPVMGQIPLVKAKNRIANVAVLHLNDDRQVLAEAYRNLRSAVVFKDAQNHPRSIVITSAIPHDGKSMTAANLAITLAQAGARVLLVDGDLRRGVLHRLFSVAGSPGLAEVFDEQLSWFQAVVQTSVPGLHLLPCGTAPRHPGVLIVKRAEKFLQEIAGHYDFCLFDTAPVMAADDVSNLAPHVDGLIMVIRAGVTPGRVAHAALNLLNLRKVKVIGLVFNAVKPNAGEYYFYRYKEYFT